MHRIVLCAALLLAPAAARAQETRFAVIDLSPSADSEKLSAEVEREIQRLRPGSKPLDDAVMRRLLAVGEGPSQTANRLLKESEEAFAAADCNKAVERARKAEPLILAALSFDEERDLLKSLYAMLAICAEKRGKADELKVAAVRLRGLVATPPADFPLALWEQHVANSTAAPATTELQIDSDPANAQIAINFHGEGVTPRTLKVAPGLVYVEVQKDGFKKAFRAVDVKNAPVRAVMRLIPLNQDRIEQAEAQLPLVRKGEAEKRPLTLSRLAQLARADTLVLMTPANGRVKIQFFDTDRGAITGEAIDSEYDAETGRVAALRARAAPASAAKPSQPQKPAAAAPAVPDNKNNKAAPGAQGGQDGKNAKPQKPLAQAPSAAAPAPQASESESSESLPEARAQEQYAQFKPRRKKPGAPWWSWLIAGAVAAAFFVFVFSDRDTEADTIGVRARWAP